MKKIQNNQSGLGVIELLFGIILITALGLIGWFVYKNQINPNYSTTNDSSTSTTTSTSSATPQSTNNKNLVTLSEIGMQITVPDSISDLNYKVFSYSGVNTFLHTDSGKPITSVALNLSTDSLAKANTNCQTSNSPLGIIMKVNGTYPKDPNSKNSGGKLVKQFSSYYIGYIEGGKTSDCGALPQKQLLENSLITLAAIK